MVYWKSMHIDITPKPTKKMGYNKTFTYVREFAGLFLWHVWLGMTILLHEALLLVSVQLFLHILNIIYYKTNRFILSLSPALWPSLSITARQAVKNTPKRLSSVTVRSPLGASPPTMDSQADSSVPTPPMDTGGVATEDTTTHSVVRTCSYMCLSYILSSDKDAVNTERQICQCLSVPTTCFLSHYESMEKDPLTLWCFWQSLLHLEGNGLDFCSSLCQPPSLCCLCQAQGVGVFLPATDAPGPGPKDGGLAALVDDSPQKRLLAQKATPPPSPLLSELLKKGNLISASPRLVRASWAWIITSKSTRMPGLENDIKAYQTGFIAIYYNLMSVDLILNLLV